MKFKSGILLFVFAQGILFSACGAEVKRWCDGSTMAIADKRYLETLAPDDDKFCVARELAYSKDIFQLMSGYYCCIYTNSILINANTTLCINICINSHNYTYPCFWDSQDYDCTNIADSGDRFPFDYTNETVLSILKEKGFKKETKGFENWLQCAKAARICCDNMEEKDLNPGKGYCRANWDGWTCLPRTEFRMTPRKACPPYIYSGELPSCQHYSNKTCIEPGTWITSNYDYATCTPNKMLRDRILYHVILLSVSIAVALPALIIFFSYRKLRITRVILHRNLVMAIVIRNIFSILVKTTITLDALADSADSNNVIAENSWWCRMFSFMDKQSSSAVFSCLLLEGIFLHRLIAAAFKGEPKMLYYYLGAAGLAVLPVAAWTVVTVLHHDVYCWAVDTGDYIYIIDGPRIFTLVVNAILMMDIVRVLCTKLRSVNTVKSNQTWRMTRATILLIPLFGVQFLVTLARPKTDNCDWEQVYYYVFYAMDGLQGTLVALLFCYFNKEVQVQLQRTYVLLQIRFHQLMGKEYKPKTRPTWAYSEHPHTTTSFVAGEEAAKKSASSSSKNWPARSDRSLVGTTSDSG